MPVAGQIKIDQVGLAEGVAGVSRTDGLATGAEVTLTNVGGSAETTFRLLWGPPDDTDAESSLAATEDTDVWTFTPTAGTYGTYLIEMLEGGVSVQTRILGVRTPNKGLLIPALNQRASASASWNDDGSEQIAASHDNSDDYSDAALNNCRYAGWWRAFHELYKAVDAIDGLWSDAPLLEENTPAENTAVIQGMIDGGIKHIQLPAGTFEFSAGGFNLASNVHLRGRGIDVTVLTWEDNEYTTDPGSQGVLNVHGASALAPITHVVLEDFTVDGNKAGVTVSGSGESLDLECISYEFAHDCIARRVRCINAEGDGLDYDDCVRCVTEDCLAEDCDGFGCHNSLRSSFNRHTRFTAINCGAVHSRGGADTHGTSPNEATDCSFVQCVMIGCYRGVLFGGHRNTASACRIDASTNTGIRVAGNDNTVEGCHVTATAGNNITIDGATGGDRNKIIGNTCNGATSGATGILATSGATNNTIVGNTCSGNAGNPIQLNAGANNNVVIGNHGAVTNSGTGNSVASNV